jgi:hypothetical protein
MRREEAWRVLGLAAQPTAREVKAAFRQLAKSTHPDVVGGGRTASQFSRITEAYEVALADAVTAGRVGVARREAAPLRPVRTPQPKPEPSRPQSEGGAPPRAHPGSTTYDGATEEEPVWDGAAWVGADSGTYWTVNPREYADPRKHGPEYRARGRRPVRRATRERSTPPADALSEPAASGSVSPTALLALGAASLLLLTVLGGGALRLLAAAALCALLAFTVLRGRRR